MTDELKDREPYTGTPVTQGRGVCNQFVPMSMCDWCDHCGYPKRVHQLDGDVDAK
jgi:hypothetical protein